MSCPLTKEFGLLEEVNTSPVDTMAMDVFNDCSEFCILDQSFCGESNLVRVAVSLLDIKGLSCSVLSLSPLFI